MQIYEEGHASLIKEYGKIPTPVDIATKVEQTTKVEPKTKAELKTKAEEEVDQLTKMHKNNKKSNKIDNLCVD